MTSPRVALAIADTQSYVLANNAIQACTARFDFNQVYVFTDAPQHWPQYQTVTVAKMQGIEDYNRIILEQLPQWIEEDFCLVCQFDGFILEASAFQPDFYNFDYIGAVWPDYPHDRVGNGGFSWRSRKLLRAVATLSYLRQAGEAEDLFICRRMRAELEAHHGCVFADERTAQRFSYEIVPHDQAAFGFHGIFNLPMVYRNNLQFLIENLPASVLAARLPYLQYGANLLDSQRRQEFDMLLSVRVSK
ncbi:MAG: DUF5672 family protein [Burkholderiales bacterium]